MNKAPLLLRSLFRRPVGIVSSMQYATLSVGYRSFYNLNTTLFSPCITGCRSFKTSPVLNAKGKGKKNSKASDLDDDKDVATPSSADIGKKMDSRLAHLKEEFSKMHAGKNSADMFNHLQVPGFGGLAEAGQISLKGGNRLTINCYDPTLVKAVADCIRDCGMSLNPTIEGGAVVVLIPKASTEARVEMVKLAGKAAEKVCV